MLIASSALGFSCVARRKLSPVPGPQRGIAFDAYQTTPSPDDFTVLLEVGATHVALFPFGYMRSHREPRVSRYEGPDIDWSLTDEGLLTLGSWARAAGLGVILIPTLADFTDGHWRGEVQMDDEESWSVFFESYGSFVLHYADLAARMQANGLSVGTELRETVGRSSEWTALIGRVRERFRGWLTYAANWDDYESVPWWSALDLVGVQAYFELGDPGPGARATRSENIAAAWAPIRDRLSALNQATGKRILFTEIGYKSHTRSTVHPWDWEISGTPDPELQAAAYEAAFDVFWSEPWFAGFYWWKWRPQAVRDRQYELDFTPQGKPAEQVLRGRYRRSG